MLSRLERKSKYRSHFDLIEHLFTEFSGLYSTDYPICLKSLCSENGTWSHEIDGRYSSDAYADEAVSIIEHHDSTDPLFLYVAFQGAHTPVQALPKHLGKCAHIRNILRKGFCGQMLAVDSAIDRVWRKLERSFPGDYAMIFFTSDNGG